MNEGWKCPVCERGVAPGEKHCDHGKVQHHYIPTPAPLAPICPQCGLPYRNQGFFRLCGCTLTTGTAATRHRPDVHVTSGMSENGVG